MADEIYNQLALDIKTAMKSGEKEKLDAIRYLKAMLLENKTSKSPIPEIDVVVKHYKKLSDSITLYPTGSEQAQKITKEMMHLKAYMPQEITESDVRTMVEEIIVRVGKNFGAVMKELSPQIKGRFDGKKATEIVKASLTGLT